ncbi:pilus assembly protein PilY [Pyxidicoccus sp. 3LG]
MRLWTSLITACALALPGAALAQDGGTLDGGVTFNPCIDTTGQDRQPDFTADAGGYSAVILTDDAPPKLRLNTNQSILDAERIILPFEQDLEALVVEDQAGNGASHTLGWFYYQDLVDQGYVAVNDLNNPNDDTLIDADGSGVPDFHEDLFNLNPARPYVGQLGPRCDKRFNQTKPDGGVVQLREPDLLTGDCAHPSTYSATGGPRRWPDGDPLYPQPRPEGSAVGRGMRWYDLNYPNANRTLTIHSDSGFTRTDNWFSDRGLFPHIPNLLEPKDPRNSNRGIGNIAMLATDDDDSTCSNSETAECLQPRMAWSADGTTQVGPVWDRAGNNDGIPDYKASAFDHRGRAIPGKNIAAAPNEEDRRVKIGRVAGDKEVVFFLLTYVEQIYGRRPNSGDESTDSCFMTRTEPDGRLQCQLWAHGDINVFFSKTLLNMDLHQTSDPVVTTKNLRNNWLSAGAYARLETPTYGRVFFEQDQPKQVRSYGQRAAHTIVGAPNNNPRVWILGWEDQNSGGNRTYDDIVILINKQNNGVFKSEVVSDISPSIARDYTITSVTLTIDDHPFYDPNGNSGACTPNIEQPDGSTFRPRPKITYQVALDCKVCVSGCDGDSPVFAPKPTAPEWVNVPFPNPTAPPGQRVSQTVSVNDLLERGYTGTQLCWRAIMESPGEGCQPTIANVNVSYKAQKAGQYARSSRIRVANTEIFGVGEVPGRNWVENASLTPSVRLKDGRPDMNARGHVYLKKLYEPQAPTVLLSDSNVTNPPLWDAGEVQHLSNRTGDPNARKLYTRRFSSGTWTRVEVKMLTANDSPLFPTTGDANLCTDVPRYDLNNDGTCTAADRTFLRDWLYGWEKLDAANPANATLSPRRTWPMGSINLSTPALVAESIEPSWLLNPNVTEAEKTQFRTRFHASSVVADRRSIAYIGTNQGFLHALDVGQWVFGEDVCTPGKDNSGYFEPTSTNPCSETRRYGSGTELFAYLPGKMLPNYVETYLRTPRADRPPATMDASPTFAAVDLGQNTNTEGSGANDYNSKRGYTPAATTAWNLNTDPTRNTGAKTVLASSTGPNQSVFFALDVTNPQSANYPWPMWEFDMANDTWRAFDSSYAPCPTPGSYGDCVNIPQIFDFVHNNGDAPVRADTRGSRHNPLLVRMDFGPRGGKKWVAAFTTDFTPNPGTAGTLYLIDVKTGQPVQMNHGSAIKQRLAGVVTLGTSAADHDEGIGGSPSAVDVDGDGSYDVLYVPSTSGKVYKVLTRDVDVNRGYGKAIGSCVIANAKTATYSGGATVEDASSQRIFSNLLLRTTRSGNSASVTFYFGTANNPDLDTDPDDLAATPRRYHVMAFTDDNPLSTTCAGGRQLWVQRLNLGQAVWGGLAMRSDVVTTATAVGKRADVCSVSDDTSGEVYMLGKTDGAALAGNGSSLGGHSFTSPMVIGNHVLYRRVGEVVPVHEGAGTLDPATGERNGSGSKVLLWDVRPGGNIREVIP